MTGVLPGLDLWRIKVGMATPSIDIPGQEQAVGLADRDPRWRPQGALRLAGYTAVGGAGTSHWQAVILDMCFDQQRFTHSGVAHHILIRLVVADHGQLWRFIGP